MIRLNSDDPMIDFCVTFHNCLGSTNAKKNPLSMLKSKYFDHYF